MAIVMIKITCADATGMAGIAAARKETFSTAHTAGAEIQSTKVRSSIRYSDDFFSLQYSFFNIYSRVSAYR